jgi:hypothetical protein
MEERRWFSFYSRFTNRSNDVDVMCVEMCDDLLVGVSGYVILSLVAMTLVTL